MSVHVEVHVNGYAVELCDDEITIYELGTRRQIDSGRFVEGRIHGLSPLPECALDNEHGTDYQNHLAIEDHLRFAVEHSGVE